MRYKCTLNFEGCGHAESEKTLKFVLRAALRPIQIEFSHSLGPDSPSLPPGQHGSNQGDKLPNSVALAETFRCRRQTDRARL